ncbi:hypothetical protein Moror_6886 [Moniliophthora roreri MCA 2997]|uniref:Smr domain-containing protein n=1 Tax=Moniliophthora roreri (strain MCA 2997) TaxID=1381753 RepID=V2XV02_MONRO|nr:hypothetical protein Moror_6886 [Moniliophthora roreri MCA 2997]
MDILVSTASSIVLRYVLSNVSQVYRSNKLIPVGLGIWEGVSIHLLLQAMPSSYDPYLAYLLRAALDFIMTRDISYVSIVTVWTVLIVLALDALGSEHFYDTRYQQPRKRNINIAPGTLHTTVHHTAVPVIASPISPTHVPRTRSLTFILPTTSPSTVTASSDPTPASTVSSSTSTQQPSQSSSSTATATASPQEQFTSTLRERDNGAESGSGSDELGYIFSSPIVDLLESADERSRPTTPITSLTLLQSPTNPTSNEKTRLPLYPFPLTNNFSPRPPPPPHLPSNLQRPIIEAPEPRRPFEIEERPEPILPVPIPAPPALFPGSLANESPERELVLPPQPEPIFIPPHTDELQTPPLGQDHGYRMEPDRDELLTPPQMRPTSSIMVHRASVKSEAPAPSLLLELQSNTLVASTSNATATPIPVPIPPREAAASPLSALDISSPGPSSPAQSIADSVLSTSDPQILFERADKLRNKAWKEAREKDRLEAELREARAEGRTRDVFLLMGDVKDCKQRMETLHARARRRYYTAKNSVVQGQGYEIDVHGLLVSEAIEATESAFREALRNGQDTLRVIVGKGNHSRDGQPKLRPAVYAAMKKHGFQCSVDSRNPGVLVLSL